MILETTINDDAVDLMTRTGVESAKVLIPELFRNRSKLFEKIRKVKRFFKMEEFSFEGSLYMSMFANFGNAKPLEDISQELCQLLEPHQVRSSPDEEKINYDGKIYDYSITYNYSGNQYLGIDLTGDSDSVEDEIQIPLVTGIVVYLIPQPEDKEAKKQLIDGYTFLESLVDRLMKKNFIQTKGFFLYILTSKNEDLTSIKLFILNAINKHEEKVKFIPSKGNELKIKLNSLVVARIGEILSVI